MRDSPNMWRVHLRMSELYRRGPGLDPFGHPGKCCRLCPAMTKNFLCVKGLFSRKRQTSMSVAEFQDYWRNRHAPLVPRKTPHLLRYVQCHVLPETYESDTPPAYDGSRSCTGRSGKVSRVMASPELQSNSFNDVPILSGPGSAALAGRRSAGDLAVAPFFP